MPPSRKKSELTLLAPCLDPPTKGSCPLVWGWLGPPGSLTGEEEAGDHSALPVTSLHRGLLSYRGSLLPSRPEGCDSRRSRTALHTHTLPLFADKPSGDHAGKDSTCFLGLKGLASQTAWTGSQAPAAVGGVPGDPDVPCTLKTRHDTRTKQTPAGQRDSPLGDHSQGWPECPLRFFFCFLFEGMCHDPQKPECVGVSVAAQQLTNLTGIYEDAGSIPGLPQWVKDPALL